METKYKYLYKFAVDVEVDVEKTETKIEDGKEITTKIKVKEPKQVEFLVKKPNRYEREEADIEAAKFLSDFINRGVMPEAILSKTYSDQGGLLDEHEKKFYLLLKEELYNLTLEYQKKTVDNAPEAETKAALQAIIEKKQEITSFEYQQNSFFSNTAEFKAKSKLIQYLLVNLTYFRDNTEKEFEIYFKGDTLDEKLDFLESLEDNSNPFYLAAHNKLILVISIFNQMGSIKSDEMGKLMEEYNLE